MKPKALTLIELLVIVAILAIVLAIVYPLVIRAPKSGTVVDRKFFNAGNGDSCSLRIKSGQDSGWIQVPCAEYAQYKVGDRYP
jgi:prepilin-type N-terminal cleavage/methylation domain-containing protein